MAPRKPPLLMPGSPSIAGTALLLFPGRTDGLGCFRELRPSASCWPEPARSRWRTSSRQQSGEQAPGSRALTALSGVSSLPSSLTRAGARRPWKPRAPRAHGQGNLCRFPCCPRLGPCTSLRGVGLVRPRSEATSEEPAHCASGRECPHRSPEPLQATNAASAALHTPLALSPRLSCWKQSRLLRAPLTDPQRQSPQMRSAPPAAGCPADPQPSAGAGPEKHRDGAALAGCSEMGGWNHSSGSCQQRVNCLEYLDCSMTSRRSLKATLSFGSLILGYFPLGLGIASCFQQLWLLVKTGGVHLTAALPRSPSPRGTTLRTRCPGPEPSRPKRPQSPDFPPHFPSLRGRANCAARALATRAATSEARLGAGLASETRSIPRAPAPQNGAAEPFGYRACPLH